MYRVIFNHSLADLAPDTHVGFLVSASPNLGLWETVGMPRDRKITYSDRQSQAAHAKKKQPKKKTIREDANQVAARIVREATQK